MNYIDVHCHLDGGVYGDIGALMEKLAAAGVKKIVAAGYDAETSLLGRELAERYPCCYFTAGIHPTELGKYREGDLEKIAALAAHPKCVAIGETGLDYHYPDTDKAAQREMFLRQLRLADSLSMPVQIHSRDCAADMLALLKENAALLKNGALMHCYSHSPELAAEFSALGLYFSFGGASTWKGSKRAQKSIAAISADRLLTETDSPYMPPSELYGVFPNTPASIPYILKNMAAIRGETEEETAERVWRNAHTLFRKLKNQSPL